MRDEDKIIHNIAISRKNLLELVVIAMSLSLGINLIAAQLLTWLDTNSLIVLLMGVALCFLSIAYLLFSLFNKRAKQRTYEAFFLQEANINNITAIPGYEFSNKIHQYLNGAFTENPALLKIWKKSYVEQQQLMIEAIEYFLLDQISHHLTDYFREKRLKKENLTTYSREDIPAVLLSNKFLELFSKPMSERSAFEGFEEDLNGGKVVYAYSNGAIYSKFNLTLPKGSKVTRSKKNEIEIETKKLKILFTVHYDGGATNLPELFEEYYLDLHLKETLKPDGIYLSHWSDEISVDIKISVKLSAMLSSSGWEYYRWVDSFLDEIEIRLSRDAFFRRINWDNVVTLLRCLPNTLYTAQKGPVKKPKVVNKPEEKSEEHKIENTTDPAQNKQEKA